MIVYSTTMPFQTLIAVLSATCDIKCDKRKTRVEMATVVVAVAQPWTTRKLRVGAIRSTGGWRSTPGCGRSLREWRAPATACAASDSGLRRGGEGYRACTQAKWQSVRGGGG